MKNSAKQFGYFTECIQLPTDRFLEYHCFRSTVKLESAVFLMEEFKLDPNMSKWTSIKFKSSTHVTRNGYARPRIQICAAFESREEFETFEQKFNEAMYKAEVEQAFEERIKCGKTFYDRAVTKANRPSFMRVALKLGKSHLSIERYETLEKLMLHAAMEADGRNEGMSNFADILKSES